MILRPARESDFPHLETFVWQAIFPAFDRPELSAAQRAENDALVEGARNEVLEALQEPNTAVFVAIDPQSRSLAGYLIADAAPAAYAQIRRIIVKRAYWGKAVAGKLMAEATNFIGRDRAISVAVRYYNERALAFFAKHDFVDTGETTGSHAIPRKLMLREAYEVLALTDPAEEETDITSETTSFWADDFPTGADEPVFEALPDYRLAVDETPLFETGANALTTEAEPLDFGETTLTDNQLSELEAFIARARAKKGSPAPKDAPPQTVPQPSTPVQRAARPAVPASPPAREEPLFDRSKIEFEVDYGDDQLDDIAFDEEKVDEIAPFNVAPKTSFEFAFDVTESVDEDHVSPEPVTETPLAASVLEPVSPKVVSQATVPAATEPKLEVSAVKPTKECPDCGSELPAVARFCYNCGHPQPEDEEDGSQAPGEEFLLLGELPEEPSGSASPASVVSDFGNSHSDEAKGPSLEKTPATGDQDKTAAGSGSFGSENQQNRKSAGGTLPKQWSLVELKIAFREYLQTQLIAYFGDRKLKAYINRLEENTMYQTLRDGSLTSLQNWLNEGLYPKATAERRRRDTFADLTEYFIVETAGDLSHGVLPQRLLRHQSVNWETVDLFKLVMDYLDFDRENELVYTDFVSMPTRSLRNATKSFIRAGKDERVFLICDQSLLSQAKNGFAVTDSGLYWKNVLQPAGELTFTTLREVRLEQGHLLLDGQFFNAGSTLNLKMALLLNKLRRFSVGAKA